MDKGKGRREENECKVKEIEVFIHSILKEAEGEESAVDTAFMWKVLEYEGKEKKERWKQ